VYVYGAIPVARAVVREAEIIERMLAAQHPAPGP
jgi:hypothetical protein